MGKYSIGLSDDLALDLFLHLSSLYFTLMLLFLLNCFASANVIILRSIFLISLSLPLSLSFEKRIEYLPSSAIQGLRICNLNRMKEIYALKKQQNIRNENFLLLYALLVFDQFTGVRTFPSSFHSHVTLPC